MQAQSLLPYKVDVDLMTLVNTLLDSLGKFTFFDPHPSSIIIEGHFPHLLVSSYQFEVDIFTQIPLFLIIIFILLHILIRYDILLHFVIRCHIIPPNYIDSKSQ